MLEYQLQYRGKKESFTTPPIIKNKVTFKTAPVWVPAADAQLLMKLNPVMFYKLAERDLENPVEDAEAIVPKEELEVPEIPEDHKPEHPKGKFVCDKCGKDYTVERFYINHIAKCDGDDQ